MADKNPEGLFRRLTLLFRSGPVIKRRSQRILIKVREGHLLLNSLEKIRAMSIVQQ